MELKEVVPFDKSQHVQSGMVKKHGQEAYGAGTFGIEIEFDLAGKSDDEYAEEILDLDYDTLDGILDRHAPRTYRSDYRSDYVDWVMEQRKNSNRRSWKWNDDFGPPDVDEWKELNPEPTERDEDGYLTGDWKEWEEQLGQAEDAYKYWERRELDSYKDGFLKSLGHDIFNYLSIRDFLEVLRSNLYRTHYPQFTKGTTDKRQAIENVTHFLIGELKQRVSHMATETTWNVGEDGDNVEVRSKHLRLNEVGLVEELLNWLSDEGYQMSEDTSAHIHIGAPDDFDMFSLLTMTTLVDEQAVKSDVGKRSLDSWAKLRNHYEQTLGKKVEEMLKETETKSMQFSGKKMEEILKKFTDKNSGTNIKAFWEHSTIEFRYFGSNVKRPEILSAWIEYFMLLPVIAMKRNQAKLGNVYFKKAPDGTILATLNRRDKAEPMSGKYLDILNQKRQDMAAKNAIPTLP